MSNISGACQCHFSCVVARSRPSCIVKLSANSRPIFNFPAPSHHNSDFYSIHALSFINGSTWRPCRFFSIIFGQPCRNAPLLVKSRSGPRSRVHDAAVFSSSHHRPPTSSPLLRLEKSLDARVSFCHGFDLFRYVIWHPWLRALDAMCRGGRSAQASRPAFQHSIVVC